MVDLATRGKIFISYRRDDSPGDARGVRDRLSREFGKANVFMDVDNLLAGQRFDRELDNALAQCDVLVAVIGLRWMKLVSGHVRSGERDFVHDEIAAALKREIVVIPALIGRKGNMPPLPRRDDLPADIRDLVLHQKQDIAHESFGRDADDLTAAIKSVLRGERRAMPWRTIAVSGAMALILAVVLSGYWMGIIPGLGSGSSVNPLRSGPDGPTVLAPSNADRAPADKGAKKTAAAARESVRQAAEETKRQADVDTASKKAEEEAAEKKAAAACEGLATSLGTPTDRLLSSIDEAAACINGMRRYPSVALLGYQAGGRAAYGGNNYTLAARLYRAAAENGGIDAMVDLGGLYRDGHGLAQDYVEARQWYEKAAALGNGGAMDRLGDLYKEGHGVAQDYAEAKKWYEKAAALGDMIAMDNLGYLYENGQGVAVDLEQALRWYQKAEEAGNFFALFHLVSLKNKMNPSK